MRVEELGDPRPLVRGHNEADRRLRGRARVRVRVRVEVGVGG